MLAHHALRFTAAALMVSAGALGAHCVKLYQIPTLSVVSVADSVRPADREELPSQSRDFQAFVQEPSHRTAKRPQIPGAMRNTNQRSSYFMLRAFRDAIGESWKGTVELVDGDDRVALGAIVDREGWIITKASQLAKKEVLCRFYDGTEARGQLVMRNDELDLALLHVNDDNLPVIQWADGNLPQRGKWVATTDTQSTPTAVGVVSAGIQSVDKRRSRLGVILRETDNGGALVEQVLRGTGADLAGIKPGDKISAIDGVKLPDHQSALRTLGSCSAGQCVMLAIERGQSTFETVAQLMDCGQELLDPTEMEVNGLISARSSGFKEVFLHDTVLHPSQCGGPLVDLDGRVVGINIARAGRVTSYALPASVVRPEVERMVAMAKTNLIQPAGTAVSASTGMPSVR